MPNGTERGDSGRHDDRPEVASKPHYRKVAGILEEFGPQTGSELISKGASRHSILKAYERREIIQVATEDVNNRGRRPVWLYYLPDQRDKLRSLERRVFIDLTELDNNIRGRLEKILQTLSRGSKVSNRYLAPKLQVSLDYIQSHDSIHEIAAERNIEIISTQDYSPPVEITMKP